MEKLFDSEMKVMEELWSSGPQTAGELAVKLAERCGWHRNTTYTVIKKLIEKGAIARTEPHFLCTPCFSRKEALNRETESLINRFFSGSRAQFFAALLSEEELTPKEVEQLQTLVDRLK